jgi:tetratricopeptide (TPR) repeat protein
MAATMDEARALLEAGRLEDAVAAFRAIAATPASPEEAGAARNNACVVLMDLGDYRGALTECREARRLREAGSDRRGLARTLNNTGLALQRLGRHAEAERAYGEALAINRERGDTQAEVVNVRNLALLYSLEGHYALAREQLDEVMQLIDQHAGEDWAPEERRLATLNLGVLLEQLGAYDEALAAYRGLLADAAQLEPRHVAALQINIGVVYRNLGDPVRALDAFNAGVAAYEALGDVASLSNAWINVGLVHHLNLHDAPAAEQAYGRALELAMQSGDREEEAWDRIYLGRLRLESGRLDEAERSLRAALDIATEVGSAEGRWTALEGIARVAIARKQDDVALERLLDAIRIIEEVRREAGGEAQRAHYFADKRDVYGAAVSVLARLDEAAPDSAHAARALELVQRAKARELIEALGPGAQPADPLDAKALQASADRGPILEYFIAEQRLFRWTVRTDSIRLRDLGPSEPILQAVESLHAELAHGSAPGSSELEQLSHMLLGGTDPGADKSLYVAPDGALQYVPFEVLSAPNGGTLLRATTISYLPSASGLAWLRTGAIAPQLQLLAFGDVPARDPTHASTAAAALLADFQLPPLTQTGRELDAARRYLAGRQHVLTGAAASEGAYRDSTGQTVGVVHLAAHALVDERLGRGAAILLAPDENEDGLLRPDEIITGRHPTVLTVLAACHSAANALESGRALSSLTGAFLAAGSKAVIATLWDVDDATTAAFMEQLYYEIGQGAAPSDALRRVKLRLSADPKWSNPAAWSGYVLIGEAHTPLVRSPMRVPMFLGALVVVTMGAVIWLWTRRRRAAASRLHAS